MPAAPAAPAAPAVPAVPDRAAAPSPASSVLVDQGGIRRWELDGWLHRLDGPAVIHADGTELWFAHDVLHRDGGPACSWSDGTLEWFRHGRPHRTDGPALLAPESDPAYYVNGHATSPDVVTELARLHTEGDTTLLETVVQLWTPDVVGHRLDALIAATRHALGRPHSSHSPSTSATS